MKSLSSYIKHINRAQVIWAAVAVVMLVAGWYFFFRAAPVVQETLTLEPKAFLQQVSVSGTVVAAKQVDLGFTQSGRITGVYATVGNYVPQGATLVVVENGDLRAALLQKQAALENQQAKLAALQAGTRPEELAVAQSTVASDKSALVNALQDAYRAAEAAVHNTLDQFISNPRTTPTLTFSVSDSNLKNSVESERYAVEPMLSVWDSASAALNASADLAAATAEVQTNLATIVSLLSDASAAINHGIPTTQVPQSTLDSYNAAVATARTNVNAAVAAVSSAKAALDAANKNLALKQAGSTPEDIGAQQAQVKAAEADVAAAQAQLAKTFITAPFGGTVTSVDAKVGQIVSPNTPEVSMISAGSFQIESYVPEVNIALIQVANKATVTLDAYGDNTPFVASVLSIDPASTVRDGVSTYRIVLQFSGADSRIRAGMTANISITTLERDNVLSVPQGAVVARDGKKFVTIKTSAGVESREVTTGALSSLGEVEILSGLSAGEVVVLPQP